MCHSVLTTHSLCPHALSNQRVPCSAFAISGICFTIIGGNEVHKVKGNVPYCHACYTKRAEVSIWMAVAEAEFRRDMQSKGSSDVRLEKEVQIWKQVMVGKLVGVGTE